MFAILFTFVTVLITTYCVIKYNKTWKHIDKLPGPKALPIVGNILEIGLNPVEYLKSFIAYWHKYDKKIYRVWVGQDPFVVITEPKDIEVVLSSNTLIKKAHLYTYLYPWLGDGLLTSDGMKWFTHRKMITPSFHFKILYDFYQVMKERSDKFVENLRAKADTKEVFDIQEEVHYATLDVICETAMGTQINAMENKNQEVVTAFQDLCYIVENRVFSIIKQNNFLFKFTADYNLQKKSLNILEKFSADVIEKRRQMLAEDKEADSSKSDESYAEGMGKRKQVFLDTLLNSTIDGKPLTYKEIYEEVQTFMFAGHDTTTSGITFALYLLSRHQKVQEKVYQEQQALFGSNVKNADPIYQDIQNMKYLDMVIKECQRLYPSVPMIGRQTTEDVEINGKLIPSGSTLVLFFFVMGYNEKYFPDPYKFDPERFNNDREKTNPYEYVPFSAGPRNCIGQKFAMLEMKTVISNIVRNYKILPPDDECLKVNGDYENLGKFDYDPVLATVLTLKAEYGTKIRLEHR